MVSLAEKAVDVFEFMVGGFGAEYYTGWDETSKRRGEK